MENLPEKFFKTMDHKKKKKNPQYIIKVSEMKGLFYVLVRKPGGKILGDECRNLYGYIKNVLERIYNGY